MEDVERWTMLNIVHGDFVEVNLQYTDWEGAPNIETGYLVMERFVSADGGMTLRVHSIGCSEPSLNKQLSQMFNRRQGFVHLCVSRPCTEAEENHLHATRVKVFTSDGFNPSYYLASHRRQVAKWLGEGGREDADSGIEVDERSPVGVGRGREDASLRALEKGSKRKELKETSKSSERPGALRSTSAAKSRARGKGVSFGDGEKSAPPRGRESRRRQATESGAGTPDDMGLGTSREREEMSTEELREKLNQVRVRLGGAPRPTLKELRTDREAEDAEARLQDAAEDSDYVEDLRSLTSGATLKRKRQVEDTRGTSTRDVSTQLVRQAQERSNEQQSRSSDSKGRRDKGSERQELLKLLNQVAGGSGSGGHGADRGGDRGERGRSRSKKKKKKDRRGKKKRRRLVNGVIISSEETRSSSEEESGSGGSSSQGGFEAPLRRRSKSSPGAVLRLLVQRAQDALDQGSLVEISKDTGKSITEGVKITTYFNLHVRPFFSQHRAAMRDLSLMSQAIDKLRSGSVATTGDLLAGHFLAAHQALIDQSWSQARYLEVADQDEQNATPAAILLEARKHAKASFKVETPDAWLPYKGWQKGWPGGGRGRWESEKGRGKTKKGGKQRDKGSWGEKEGKGKNKWKETHEKGEKEEK